MFDFLNFLHLKIFDVEVPDVPDDCKVLNILVFLILNKSYFLNAVIGIGGISLRFLNDLILKYEIILLNCLLFL